MKGGDGVASRTTVAAAACLLASGLLVGGSCASIAFADPDSGKGGSDNGGSSGGGSSGGGSAGGGSNNRPGFGFGFGQRPGAPSGGVSGDAPKSVGQVPDFGVRLPGRPGALIGDGRNGRIGTVPKIGDTAGSGSAAAPPPGSTPGSGEPSAPSSAASSTAAAPAPVVVIPLPTPDATSTGITLAPTSVPSATPLAEPPGWWSTSKIPQIGVGNPDQAATAPSFTLPQASPFQLPTALPAVLPTGVVLPDFAPIFDVVTGLATAASQLPFVTLLLPVVVPPVGAPGGATDGGHRAAGGSTPPRLPPGATAGGSPSVTGKVGIPQDPPPRKQSPDFAAGSGLTAAGTYRAGYDDYLRAAGVGKVAAVAVPGVSGILLLTGMGGLIGYRQARAGSVARASGPGRFMG